MKALRPQGRRDATKHGRANKFRAPALVPGRVQRVIELRCDRAKAEGRPGEGITFLLYFAN